MSRVLKFRQWIIEKQLMTAPFILDHEFDCVTESFGPDLITMQFTGLLDKNGKEIYEGDIIKHPDFLPDDRLIVNFENGAFCLSGWDFIRTDSTKGEIIGNIHENKDIL